MTVHVRAPLPNSFSSRASSISSGAVNHLWLHPQRAGPRLGQGHQAGGRKGQLAGKRGQAAGA